MLNSPRPYFLYVGGFDSRKQVPKMINAFALAARHIDEALVIGGNLKPAMRLIIEELIQQRGLNDRILLPGFVEQSWLPALYRQATAHLMFSRYEGFGMTITEAFACGCPVVALRASCIPEIAGDAALLVENNTLEEMAEAMQRIATEVNLQTDLRQKGLERARHFTWERCAAQTIEVYRHLLAL
jgi:glycosyltransferase involved in cell wall biosynthesis